MLRWVSLLVLIVVAVGTQVVLDGKMVRFTPEQSVQWVRSPELMRRVALGFESLAADVYWIRAVQYYGSTRLSTAERKNFDLLYPLLDITTTLDPRFNIAYRFGAILLSEGYPNGPGNPDDAIRLLEKGIRTSPKWEYFLDAGFVHYWWRQDPRAAADWFLRGSKLPGAPNWLQPLAASVLAEGGDRTTSRVLWTQLAETAEHDWMRQTARLRLQMLDAEEVIEQLQPIVNGFYDVAGRFPSGWAELARAGRIRGIPLDPTGVAYALDPVSGAVDLSPYSSLYLLRRARAVPGQTP
jgi:hypothetical protein